MSMSIVTPIGRASFPNLSKPDQYDKYSIAILLPKTDPKVTEFVRWLRDAVNKEAMSVVGQAGLASAMALFTNFKDGDSVAAFKTYRAEYAGHYILNVSRKSELGKPCTVNRNSQPIDPSEIYAGCNILMYIDVYCSRKYKRPSISFQHVMKTGENTPFSATGVKVDDAFAALDIPEEEEIQQGLDTPSPFKTDATLTQTAPETPQVANPFSGV